MSYCLNPLDDSKAGPTQRQRLAVHEAGHIVIGWRTGEYARERPFGHIWIDAQGLRGGVEQSPAVRFSLDHTDAARAVLKARAAAWAAGERHAGQDELVRVVDGHVGAHVAHCLGCYPDSESPWRAGARWDWTFCVDIVATFYAIGVGPATVFVDWRAAVVREEMLAQDLGLWRCAFDLADRLEKAPGGSLQFDQCLDILTRIRPRGATGPSGVPATVDPLGLTSANGHRSSGILP